MKKTFVRTSLMAASTSLDAKIVVMEDLFPLLYPGFVVYLRSTITSVRLHGLYCARCAASTNARLFPVSRKVLVMHCEVFVVHEGVHHLYASYFVSQRRGILRGCNAVEPSELSSTNSR